MLKININPLVSNNNTIERITQFPNISNKIIDDIKIFEDSKFAQLNLKF